MVWMFYLLFLLRMSCCSPLVHVIGILELRGMYGAFECLQTDLGKKASCLRGALEGLPLSSLVSREMSQGYPHTSVVCTQLSRHRR